MWWNRQMAEAAFRTDAARRQIDALERLLQDRNRLLASRSRQAEAIFNAQGPEAFVAMLQQTLATSVYPYGMQGSCAAVYRPEARELLIEYELPRADVIPVVEAYRYVKTMGLVQPSSGARRRSKDLYGKLIASVTLRTLAEAFDASAEDSGQRNRIQRLRLRHGHRHWQSDQTGANQRPRNPGNLR